MSIHRACRRLRALRVALFPLHTPGATLAWGWVAVVVLGLLVLVAGNGWSGPVLAASMVSIDHLDRPVMITDQLQVLADPSRSLSVEEVREISDPARWQVNADPILFRADTGVRYWFQVTLELSDAARGQHPSLVIPVFVSQVYRLNLWLRDSTGATRAIETGYLRPYQEAWTGSGYYAFPLLVAPGPVVITGYVDHADLGLPVSIPLQVVSADQLDQMKDRQFNVLIAFYSVMAVILIYNMFLWWSIRQPLYGCYVLFLVLGVSVNSVLDGSFQRLFFTASAAADFVVGQMLVVLMGVAYLAFVKRALDEFRFARWAQVGYRILIGVGIALFLSFVAAGLQPWVGPLSNLYLSVGIVYLLAVIVRAFVLRIPLAGYFLLSELMPIAGGAVFLAQVYGVLPANEWLQWSTHLGFAVEAVLLSLAVAAQTKIAQQNALLHLKQYEQLYQDSIEGRLRFNRTTQVVTCNRALADMLGYEGVDDPAIAEDFLRLYHSSQFADVRGQKNAGAFAKGYSLILQNRRTGQDVWVVAFVRVGSSPAGRFDQIEVTLLDETERHLREQAQLEKEQVQIQNRAKSQFFASMSHEFRAPLTAVLGYTELAMDPGASARERLDHLRTIRNSAEYMLHLINDTLDLSKIEAQKMTFHTQAFELPALCKELYDYGWILASRKHIRFRVDYEFPLPRILVSDRTRLKQVLVNLCSNAIKFTEQGEVVVRVWGEPKTSRLFFAVRDTGVGIRPEQMEKLFEAFAQAHEPSAEPVVGTGLGLHLSRQIAEGLGGAIEVQSSFGQGSTFTLSIVLEAVGEDGWLDAFAPAAMSLCSTEPAIASVPDPAGHGSMPKVLVVDDNDVNLKLLSVLLGRLGAQVCSASNGLDAIATLISQKPDLVFMDIDMPVMDGMAAIQHMRNLQLKVPVYALTGSVSKEMMGECRRQGFDGHLGKPYDRHTIEAILRIYAPN